MGGDTEHFWTLRCSHGRGTEALVGIRGQRILIEGGINYEQPPTVYSSNRPAMRWSVPSIEVIETPRSGGSFEIRCLAQGSHRWFGFPLKPKV